MSFIQGTQAANQNINTDRAERVEGRAAKQQRLTNLIKGFEIDPSTGQYAPNQRGQTALDVQNQQLQQQLSIVTEQNHQIQSVLNKDTMTDTVTTMLKGDVEGGWKKINQNPGLLKMLNSKGMEDLQQVNWMADKELLKDVPALAALTPEQLQDPQLMNALNSAYFKVKKNGKWQVNTTESLMKVTGTQQYTDRKTNAGITNRLNRINEILQGKVQTPYERRLKEQQTILALKQNEHNNNIADLTINDMNTFLEENPNATLAQYQAHIAKGDPKAAIELEKAKIGLETARLKLKEAKAEGTEAVFPRNEFHAAVEDSYKKYDGTGNVFSNDEWSVARNQQGKNKVDATTKRAINDRINLMEGFGKVKEGFEELDQNAWEKSKSVFSKYVPADWMSLTPEEQAKMTKRLKEESRLGGYIADYIKMMSGAAVTDSERVTFTDIISSNKFATKDAFLAALSGFRETLGSSTNNLVDATRTETPYTYLGFREQMAKKGFNRPAAVGTAIPVNPNTQKPGYTPPPASSFMSP